MKKSLSQFFLQRIISAIFLSGLCISSFAQISIPDDVNFNIANDQPVYTNLKKALRNAKEVTKLDLSNKGLTEFPMDILKLKELKYLYLDSNKITAIPEQISELQKLQLLSVFNNAIRTIPPGIGELRELQYLFLDSNQLSALPPELFRLTKLRKLFINKNKLTELPSSIKTLKSLRVFIASDNQFEKIPPEISELSELTVLSFSSNYIKEVPEAIYTMPRLKTISLWDNQLTRLSSSVKKWENLEMLGLGNNKLKALPAEIAELNHLKELYINNNEFQNLSSESGEIKGLEIFDISDNPLTELPQSFSHLEKLKDLYVRNISFKPFPQVLYDMQNNGTVISGLKSKELYNIKLLLSRARNKKLTGNVKEAIGKYQELLQIDTNNVTAMYELASAYLEIKEYDSAATVCSKALSKNASSKLLSEIRIVYSNSLNKTNKLDNIITTFEANIRDNPADVELYFKLGKYYYDQEKYEDARNTFLRALKVNPSHVNSHLYSAVTSHILNQDQIFVFAALRFITMATEGNRTRTLLPFVYIAMHMKTGNLSSNGSMGYNDSYVIRDENNEIIYKSANPIADIFAAMLSDLVKNKVFEGNITINNKHKGNSTDSILTDSGVKNVLKEAFNVGKNNVEIFQSELKKICSTQIDSIKKEDMPFWNYYLPYYSNLIVSGHIETFAYIINNKRREEDYITQWLKSNPEKVEKFTEWNKTYQWKKE